MTYRSRVEIIDAILRSIGSGATRTRIMYKAFLSYTQVKEYLVSLEEKGLIKYDKEKRRYSLTERGSSFINAYGEVRKVIYGEKEERMEKLARFG